MPGSLSIQVVEDTATPLLESLERLGADLRPVLTRWGVAVRNQAQQTARSKGGKNFWGDLARTIRVADITDDSVTVYTDHVAGRQKQEGGAISAPGRHSRNPAKALTIPLPGSGAEGTRAAEWPGLFRVKSKKGNVLLAIAAGDGGIDPLFVLKKRTRRQDADPYWPTPAQTAALGEREAAWEIQRKVG